MYSRNVESLRDIPVQSAEDDDDNFGYYHAHRGTKQPVRMKVICGTKKHSFRWALSGQILYQGDTIVMEFVGYTVTIKGRGLDMLFESLDREKTTLITETRTIGDSYIETITVEPRE
jgi:hypothetical protein